MIFQVASVRLDAHATGRQRRIADDGTVEAEATIDARASIRASFRPPPRYDDEGDVLAIVYDFHGGPLEGIIRTGRLPLRMKGRITGWEEDYDAWDRHGPIPRRPLDCAVGPEAFADWMRGEWRRGSAALALFLPPLPSVGECGFDTFDDPLGGDEPRRVLVPRRALRRRVVRIPVRVTKRQPNLEDRSQPPTLLRWTGEIRLRRVMSCPLHANDECAAFHDE